MASNPTLLTTPIAQNGDKNAIPNTTSATSGLLSQDKGWQSINSLPLTAGGIAPNRLDFNGAFNLLSNILFYAQKGWQFEFDESQDYYAGCIVRDTVDGKLYECLNDVSASSTHPNADSTNWKNFGDIDPNLFANTNLSNITTTGKGNIVNQIMPDYANGITWTYTTAGVEQTYTAPSKGWFNYVVWGQNDSIIAYVKINGNNIILGGGSWGSTRGDIYSGCVFVPANAEIKVKSVLSNTTLGFYPCIG